MTIDKAIETLTKIAEEYDEDWLDFEYAALQLGIEALKRVKLERKLGTYEMNYNLPGETEE